MDHIYVKNLVKLLFLVVMHFSVSCQEFIKSKRLTVGDTLVFLQSHKYIFSIINQIVEEEARGSYY